MSQFEGYPTGLIIVPGHALFQSWVTEVPTSPQDDRFWILQPFQAGEPGKYLEHIEEGVDTLATGSRNSMLIFSGGRTREEIGRWSEASSYFAIAEQLLVRNGLSHLLGITTVEEYARDSLENVANSRALFRHLFGYYPLQTTVVGWEFKRKRYEHHAATLNITDSMVYIGRNDPDDLNGAIRSEQLTLEAFQQFPFGTGGILKSKRERRTFEPARPPFASHLPQPLSREHQETF